jgi:hypothetical protein
MAFLVIAEGSEVKALPTAAEAGVDRLRTPDLVRQPTENVETTWPQSTEKRA